MLDNTYFKHISKTYCGRYKTHGKEIVINNTVQVKNSCSCVCIFFCKNFLEV